MFKEKFEIVLQKNEEIKWCNKSNAISSMLKGIIPVIGLGVFLSIWATMFFGGIIAASTRDMGFPDLRIALYLFIAIIVCYIIFALLNGKNTYFCITNKRVIKRSGAFKSNFVHYTLKNIGTTSVVGSIVDVGKSATLLITTKDFHTDAKGNTQAKRLKISSLRDAYTAYSTLSEMVEGNNESLRVKLEK